MTVITLNQESNSLLPISGDISILSHMEQSSSQEEIRYFENPSQFKITERDEQHNDGLQGESDGSRPLDQQADDIEA